MIITIIYIKCIYYIYKHINYILHIFISTFQDNNKKTHKTKKNCLKAEPNTEVRRVLNVSPCRSAPRRDVGRWDLPVKFPIVKNRKKTVKS